MQFLFSQKAWWSWSKLALIIVGFFIFSTIIGIFSPSGQKSFKEGLKKGEKATSANLSPTVAPTAEATLTPKETQKPNLSPSVSSKPSSTSPSPSQAKQVSLSVFKQYFRDNFDYGQFSKIGTSSDNWDFYESNNTYGDKLVLAAIGEDLKNGILKTGPNDSAATQVITFFLLGHPLLINSGWVEDTVSIIEKGKNEETTLQSVDASIMLSPDNVWIVSFTEK